MKSLLLLLAMAGTMLGQGFTLRDTAFVGVATAQETSSSGIYGLVTNQTGYPVLSLYDAVNYTTNTYVYLSDSWTNSWHLTNQGASSIWPKKNLSGLNGLPTLTFDATDDKLQNNIYTSTQPHEVIMVAKYSAGGLRVLFTGTGANVNQANIDNSKIQVIAGSITTASLPLTNVWAIFDFIFLGNSSTLFTNNVQAATVSAGGNPASGLMLSYDSPYAANMEVAQIVTFGGLNNNAIPGTNDVARSNVWYSLKTQYGL